MYQMEEVDGMVKKIKYGEYLLCGTYIIAVESPSGCMKHLTGYHNIKKEWIDKDLIKRKNIQSNYGL